MLYGLLANAIAEGFQKTASERLRVEGEKLKPVLSVLVIEEECRKIPYLSVPEEYYKPGNNEIQKEHRQ
jgi:hypothetical protein